MHIANILEITRNKISLNQTLKNITFNLEYKIYIQRFATSMAHRPESHLTNLVLLFYKIKGGKCRPL